VLNSSSETLLPFDCVLYGDIAYCVVEEAFNSLTQSISDSYSDSYSLTWFLTQQSTMRKGKRSKKRIEIGTEQQYIRASASIETEVQNGQGQGQGVDEVSRLRFVNVLLYCIACRLLFTSVLCSISC
jgi:hypothetical protein